MKKDQNTKRAGTRTANGLTFEDRFRLKTRRILKFVLKVIFYFVLACLAYQILYPLLYVLAMSIREPEDALDPTVIWIPKHLTLQNFADAAKSMVYADALKNSIVICLCCGTFDVFSCAVAGYGFSRFKFPGRGALFALVIFTLVVPVQTLILPDYVRWRYADFGGLVGLLTGEKSIRLIGTYWPFILPSALAMGTRSGLYIFIFRQFFINMSSALEDAAYIDGCGPFRTFFNIMLPNVQNALVTVFLFSFVWNWGEYYQSKQLLGSTKRTVMVALSSIRVDLSSVQALSGIQLISNPEIIATRVMAGACLVIAPMILVFVLTQRYFADSVEHFGVK